MKMEKIDRVLVAVKDLDAASKFFSDVLGLTFDGVHADESQDVKYDETSLNALVDKSQGSPIYVRYMVDEIATEAKTGKASELTSERIRKAPAGMTDYVAGILARILFNLEGTTYTPKEGALPVIKTLLS